MKNEIIKIDENTSYLVLKSNTYGKKFCVIDNEDIPRIRMFNWAITFVTERNKTHYVSTTLLGKTIMLHRLILSFPDMQIDHIDMNGLNNSKSNLRLVTASQNCLNKKVTRNNRLGVKGIQKRSYRNGSIKYRARITVNKKLINLGQSDSVEGAIKLRKEYEKANFILSS